MSQLQEDSCDQETQQDASPTVTTSSPAASAARAKSAAKRPEKAKGQSAEEKNEKETIEVLDQQDSPVITKSFSRLAISGTRKADMKNQETIANTHTHVKSKYILVLPAETAALVDSFLPSFLPSRASCFGSGLLA